MFVMINIFDDEIKLLKFAIDRKNRIAKKERVEYKTKNELFLNSYVTSHHNYVVCLASYEQSEKIDENVWFWNSNIRSRENWSIFDISLSSLSKKILQISYAYAFNVSFSSKSSFVCEHIESECTQSLNKILINDLISNFIIIIERRVDCHSNSKDIKFFDKTRFTTI